MHLTKSTRPKVDVIIPTTWKDLGYFQDALNSVFQQDYQEINITISTDTHAVDKSSAKKWEWESFLHKNTLQYPSLKCVSNKKRWWAAATRNEWIKNTNADLVAFLDDDDIRHKQKIQKQEMRFLDQKKLWVLWTNWVMISSKNEIIWKIATLTWNIDIQNHIAFHCPVIQSSAMVRRETWNLIWWYDDSYFAAEDYKLWSDIASKTHYNFDNIQEDLLLYRSHENNVSHQRSRRQKLESLIISLHHVLRSSNKADKLTYMNLKKLIVKTLHILLTYEQIAELIRIIKWAKSEQADLKKAIIKTIKPQINIDYTAFGITPPVIL